MSKSACHSCGRNKGHALSCVVFRSEHGFDQAKYDAEREAQARIEAQQKREAEQKARERRKLMDAIDAFGVPLVARVMADRLIDNAIKKAAKS